MGHDDRHIREIDRDVIDVHGIAILQTHASAAGHAGADAAVSRVKNHR
jgi:hypothetical protein